MCDKHKFTQILLKKQQINFAFPFFFFEKKLKTHNT